MQNREMLIEYLDELPKESLKILISKNLKLTFREDAEFKVNVTNLVLNKE